MSSSSRVKVALTRHLQQHALGLRSGTCARLLMANETRRCTDAPSRGSIIQVYRMGGMMEDDLARICCRAEEARPTDRPTRSVGCVAMAHRALTGREKARSLRSCGRGACLLVALPACARLVRPPSSARFAKGRRRQTKRVLHAARDSLRICASHLLHCGQTACTSRGGADFRHHVTQWLHRQTAPCQRHARGVHRTLRPLSAHGREAYCSRALAKLLSDIDFDAVCQQ